MHAAGHQTGDMRHIHVQIGTDFIGDLAEGGPVPFAAVSGAAGEDQLGLVLARLGADLVHVQQLVLLAHAIGNHVEPFARHVDRRAVGQVATRVEIQPHEGIAGFQQRQEHRLVHLRARIGLNIGEFTAEQFLGALDRQGFGDVDELAAAVIAFAGIALGIFVGQHRALRLQHREADDVFRGDQFDLVALAAQLVGDGTEQFGVAGGKGFGKEAGITVWRVHIVLQTGKEGSKLAFA